MARHLTINQDDSDLQYMGEVNRLEESLLRKRTSAIDDSITSIPSSQSNTKKRKEAGSSNSDDDEKELISAPAGSDITSFQSKRTAVEVEIEDDDDDIIIDLVKPVASKQLSTAVTTTNRPFYKTNSFSGSSNVVQFGKASSSSSKHSASNLDESVQIIPLNHPKGYSYQFDGLGGRKRIFNSDLGSSASSSSNLATSSRSSTTSLANRNFKFKH